MLLTCKTINKKTIKNEMSLRYLPNYTNLTNTVTKLFTKFFNTSVWIWYEYPLHLNGEEAPSYPLITTSSFFYNHYETTLPL